MYVLLNPSMGFLGSALSKSLNSFVHFSPQSGTKSHKNNLTIPIKVKATIIKFTKQFFFSKVFYQNCRNSKLHGNLLGKSETKVGLYSPHSQNVVSTYSASKKKL